MLGMGAGSGLVPERRERTASARPGCSPGGAPGWPCGGGGGGCCCCCGGGCCCCGGGCCCDGCCCCGGGGGNAPTAWLGIAEGRGKGTRKTWVAAASRPGPPSCWLPNGIGGGSGRPGGPFEGKRSLGGEVGAAEPLYGWRRVCCCGCCGCGGWAAGSTGGSGSCASARSNSSLVRGERADVG